MVIKQQFKFQYNFPKKRIRHVLKIKKDKNDF